MIDLERLWTCDSTQRRSGSTFRMLVEAAQLVDFNREDVWIIGRDNEHSQHLRNQFRQIAEDLGIVVISENHNTIAVVYDELFNKHYHFMPTNKSLSGKCHCLFDHSVSDEQWYKAEICCNPIAE